MDSRPGIPRPRALTRVLRAVRPVYFDVAPSQSGRRLAVRAATSHCDGERIQASRFPIVRYSDLKVHSTGTAGAGARNEGRTPGVEGRNRRALDGQARVMVDVDQVAHRRAVRSSPTDHPERPLPARADSNPATAARCSSCGGLAGRTVDLRVSNGKFHLGQQRAGQRVPSRDVQRGDRELSGRAHDRRGLLVDDGGAVRQ